MRAILTLGALGALATTGGCGFSRSAPKVDCAPASLLGAASPLPQTSVTLHFDYSGTEALLEALERGSLSDADVDALLQVHGVRATVDNVTRFIPETGVPEFRAEIKQFVERKRGGSNDRDFQLSHVWRERASVVGLASAIRANEDAIIRQSLALIEQYRPNTGPLAIQVYFVAGGVSDGFVFEDEEASFYVNLTRAGGDCHEMILNLVHEAYHVAQAAAQRRSGNFAATIAGDSTPLMERVLRGTLLEGTANFVADPARMAVGEQSLRTARERYRRSANPARIAENFAVFDTVVQGVQRGTMTWDEVSEKGFIRSAEHEDRFYFVGYEMAKAIERYCGAECIGRLFDEPPVEFFRTYIGLYREHPEIWGRFGAETETLLMAGR